MVTRNIAMLVHQTSRACNLCMVRIVTMNNVILKHVTSASERTVKPQCQGNHSDKATTCPRRPLQPGQRDAISSQLTLDKATTWRQRPRFEGPLSSGRLTQVSLYLHIRLAAGDKIYQQQHYQLQSDFA